MIEISQINRLVSIRAMPYIDDTLVRTFSLERPSNEGTGKPTSTLQHSQDTNLIPLTTSGHRQFLIITLHNTSGIPLTINDIKATDIDGHCLSTLQRQDCSGSLGNQEAVSRSYDDHQAISGLDLCDTERPLLAKTPLSSSKCPAIVGVPENLTIGGKWSCVLDVAELSRRCESQIRLKQGITHKQSSSASQPLMLLVCILHIVHTHTYTHTQLEFR